MLPRTVPITKITVPRVQDKPQLKVHTDTEETYLLFQMFEVSTDWE